MKKKKFVSIVVAITIILTSGLFNNLENIMAEDITNYPSGICGENLTWVLQNETLTIRGTGKMNDWRSNSPWNEYYRSDIKHVVIEEGVTTIGQYAFNGCDKLTSIHIPTSVTSIGEGAFSYCSLEEVKLPQGLKRIGYGAFFNSKLKEIKIPSGVMDTGERAFEQCEELISVELSQGIKKIGDRSFEGSGLKQIKIPAGVTDIGEYAFFQCEALTQIDIPSSVEKIGLLAFAHCTQLEEVKLPQGLKRIGYGAFFNSKLKEIKIPAGVTEIGKSTFERCKELTNVKLPFGLRTIGYSAFDSCSSLREIKIPFGVTEIGIQAFYDCEMLTRVDIPSSVKKIEESAFNNKSDSLTIYGVYGSYAQNYALEKNIKFRSVSSLDASVSYTATAEEVEAFLDELLEDQDFAKGKIDGVSMDFAIKDNKYTFTPLNFDFATGMPLSNLNYQAVIDTESKTVKVLLGVSKNGKSEITQTTDVNSTSWGQQYQSVKKMYKDLTGCDANTSRATWNNFEKMKAELNSLKCDMFVSADMKITGFLEFSFAEDGSGSRFKEGGIIEKVSADTKFSSPVVAPWVYISLGLGVSEEGTLKVQMNDNVPELLTSLELAAKASAKITGQIPVIAKIEGMIDAEISANIANTDPRFTIDMSGNISLKASALAGIIEIYDNKWNYLNCQIYPEFVNKQENTSVTYNSTDEMLCSAASTDRIEEEQNIKLSGQNFSEQNVYSENDAELVNLSDNRELLLWLDDKEEKSDNNRTSLMYSIYDGNNWSIPKEVYGDGCFDGEFAYTIGDNQQVYVVFQKGNYVFGDDTEYTDIVRNIDPYVTVFDGNSFSDPEKVRDDNNSYEDNFKIHLEDGKLKVSYVEYTSDYLAGDSDSMRLLENINDESIWNENEICTEDSFVSDYEYIGNQLYLQIYNSEKECYALYILNNGKEEFLKVLSQEVKLVADGKYLYYVDNNVLNILNTEKTAEYSLSYGTDYQIITNGSNTKLTYEVINDDYSTALYCGNITDGLLDEVLVYRSEEGFIKNYSGCIDQYGNLNIVTTLCTLGEDLSENNYTLNVVGRGKQYSLASTYLYYDENDVVADKDLDLYYDVTNNGNEDISGYEVILYNENGNILAGTQVEADIKVGEMREEKLIYHIPPEFSEQKVYIQIQDINTKNIYSTVETVIKHNDIEITGIQFIHQCNGNYSIVCTLQNNGYQNADGIELTIKNHGAEIAKELIIDNLNIGQTYTASVKLKQEEYDNLSSKDLYIDATCSLSESNYENNSKTISPEKIVVEGEHNWTIDDKSDKYICSICGKKIEDDYTGTFKGHSLSLSGNIGLNFVMQLSDSLLVNKENTYVEFRVDGSKKSTYVYLKDADEVNYDGEVCYSFKCKVNAAEMTKKVTAVLHCNDWTGESDSYSIYDYACQIFVNQDKYEKAVPLVKAMLNYGGYSQVYFDERIDDLANVGLYDKENDPVYIADINISQNYNYPAFDKDMGLSFLGGSLVLNSGTDLKLYYYLSDPKQYTNFKIYINGKESTPFFQGNVMCIKISNISVLDLENIYDIDICISEKRKINQKYSAMTYMYKALNLQSDKKLIYVIRALDIYHEAAKQYNAM